MKRVVVLQLLVVGDSIVKRVKGWELSTIHELFVVRSFPGAKRHDMVSYLIYTKKLKNKSTLKNKPERINSMRNY